MRYCFDIDGTICITPNKNGVPDYVNSQPIPIMIKFINNLYDEGHFIIFQTARGKSSGIDWTELTKKHLKEWGFKYHELFDMFCKPTVDIFVDDKGINVEEWKLKQPLIKGIIAGAFDLIHPGYIQMFKEAKRYCNHLSIALHDNPCLERPHKIKPVQNVNERMEILNAIKYIDNVFIYKLEEEFLSSLINFDIRFLGMDYKNGDYTGKGLPIKIVWIKRDHSYSTTKLKKNIFNSLI